MTASGRYPVSPSVTTLASHEVKDATELTVRVSPAGLELDRGGRRHLLSVAWVQLGAAEFEPVDEQPYPVPAHRPHAAARDELAELLHRVGPAWDAEHPDLGPGVERREGVVPAPFHGRAHRARPGVARHDRDDPAD